MKEIKSAEGLLGMCLDNSVMFIFVTNESGWRDSRDVYTMMYTQHSVGYVVYGIAGKEVYTFDKNRIEIYKRLLQDVKKGLIRLFLYRNFDDGYKFCQRLLDQIDDQVEDKNE